jgi:small-conductance mechanosensitive channel
LRSEYLEKAKRALTDAGIEIPFPHVQLMLGDTPALDKLSQGRAA